MRLYLDAAPLIYLVEKRVPLGLKVRRRLEQPGVSVITRELNRLECRVIPLRDGNAALLRDFDKYFAEVAEMVPVDRAVLELATGLRARHASLKTPDAIHLAAALTAGCDVFLTNDRRLDRCGAAEGIAVETLTP